jgi:putative transposase
MKHEFRAISTFWSVRKSKGHLWSPSYFVGSVGGAPITVVRQYIEGQNRPSAGARRAPALKDRVRRAF